MQTAGRSVWRESRFLLTLMALIHHKDARLPHGRTELYDRIATAYLESIDVRRKLDQVPYSLAQKKRWLADIAYRMQNRRTGNDNDALLVSGVQVQGWLTTSLKEIGSETLGRMQLRYSSILPVAAVYFSLVAKEGSRSCIFR